ncbi:MAG: NADH-dependent dehydrogenase [Candidatus Poribacteria bacterium]|nr:MAG: NADH-dependent dehydrogenase [Candidatus Poribacteria bacterium]
MAQEAPLRGVGIGCGYFSQFHYEAWNRISGVQLVAVADLRREVAETIARRFGIPRVYTDWRQMVFQERPDFVDIITPPGTHLEIVSALAPLGVPMICQKPLAPTYAEAEEIARIAQAHNARLMVHENWRWQPWYREMKRLLEERTIGELVALSVRTRLGDGWRPDAYLDRQPYFREYPRLLVFETGVHFLDTFRFLGGEVASIYAVLRRLNPHIQGEDWGLILCRFCSGATALWDASRYHETEAENPRYTFGTVRLDATGGHLELDESGRIRIKRLGEPAFFHPYAPSREGFAGDSVRATFLHFLECLQSGRPFETEANEYLRTLQLVEACYASAETGQAVPIVPTS